MAICPQEKCNDIFIFTKISKYINNNDFEEAQKALTNYFEFILKRIIKLNEIKLPYKKEYFLNDYYASVKLYLKDLFKNSPIEKYYDDVFVKIDKTRFMKNLMSNEQDEIKDLNKNDLNIFKTAVDEFKKSVTCNKHETNYLEFKKDIINCNIKECDFTLDLTK